MEPPFLIVKTKVLLFFGKYDTMVELAGVAEWQTRRIQNPLAAMSCGFKSHLRHRIRLVPVRGGLFCCLKKPLDWKLSFIQRL